VDLETLVQGIDVILDGVGSADQAERDAAVGSAARILEVLTLLTDRVGADVGSDADIAAERVRLSEIHAVGSERGWWAGGGESISGRLASDFFGVSKLKIDPQLTGVENNPQGAADARTASQQESDLYLHYESEQQQPADRAGVSGR